MKRFLGHALLLAGILVGSESFASNSMLKYFRAVVKSNSLNTIVEKNEGWQLNGILLVETFRCPGCFRFHVSLKPAEVSEAPVREFYLKTRLDLETKKVVVELDRQR